LFDALSKNKVVKELNLAGNNVAASMACAAKVFQAGQVRAWHQ
jgi:hypothetical protein